MTTARAEGRADAATVLVVGRVLATAADAITPLLIVRLLAKADVATLSALLLVHATIGMMLSTGLSRALLYYLANRPVSERRALARTVVLAQFGLSTLGAFALVTVASVWPKLVLGEPVPQLWLWLLAAYAVLDLPTRLLPNLLVVENAARASAAMSLFRSLGLVSAMIIPAALGLGLAGILAGHVVFSVVHVLALLAWMRHLYRDAQPAPSPVPPAEMVRFSLPLSATDVVSWLNASLDRYLILWLQPPVRFAEYRAGAWQIPVLTAIPYSIATVDTPQYVALFKAGKGPEAVAMWRSSVHKVALLVTPVSLAFAAAGTPFIRLAFTADYLDAVPVFQAYCVVTAMRVAAFGNLLIAAGKTQNVLRAATLTFLANAALSVPLALWLGFVGPAIGTALAIFPTFWIWSKAIADAAGVPVNKTFPWLEVGKVFAVTLPGVVAAQALQRLVPMPDAPLLAAQIGLTLLSAWGLGSLLGVVTTVDRAYALRVLRGKFMGAK
jgi:O-antigen/teichoic acid export membrane protein